MSAQKNMSDPPIELDFKKCFGEAAETGSEMVLERLVHLYVHREMAGEPT